MDLVMRPFDFCHQWWQFWFSVIYQIIERIAESRCNIDTKCGLLYAAFLICESQNHRIDNLRDCRVNFDFDWKFSLEGIQFADAAAQEES